MAAAAVIFIPGFFAFSDDEIQKQYIYRLKVDN
jgi:hypothetical protein